MHSFRLAPFGLVLVAGILWVQASPPVQQQGSGASKDDSQADGSAKPPPEPRDKQQATQPTPAQSEQGSKAGATTTPQPSGKADGSVLTPQTPPEQVPVEPKQPKTEILDSSATAGALATDGHDPILDPPPFPKGTTTLVGGVISGIDHIRNHLTVSVFGGGHWVIFYDERTHIFRSGAEATSFSLRKGERVYVDTMLDNNGRDIFARNIRVGVAQPPALVDGQIIDFDL